MPRQAGVRLSVRHSSGAGPACRHRCRAPAGAVKVWGQQSITGSLLVEGPRLGAGRGSGCQVWPRCGPTSVGTCGGEGVGSF